MNSLNNHMEKFDHFLSISSFITYNVPVYHLTVLSTFLDLVVLKRLGNGFG